MKNFMANFVSNWVSNFTAGLGSFFLYAPLSMGLALGDVAQAASISAPCIDSADPTVIATQRKPGSAHAGERTCSEMTSRYLSKFDERISLQAESWYRGCDLDTSANAPSFTVDTTLPTGSNVCTGTPVAGVTCNALRNGVPATYNKRRELSKNHNGVSCGSWPRFESKVTDYTCRITPHYGEGVMIEQSYERGTFIQALNCFHQQVKNELAKNSLTITPGGPCEKPSAAFAGLGNDMLQISGQIKKDFGAEANLPDVDNCTEQVSVTQTDPGRLRQSACQLASVRQTREAMFYEMAACEVFARAKVSYEKFKAKSPSGGGVAKAVRAELDGLSGNYKLCNEATIRNGYTSTFFKLLKQKSDKIWNAEACK
jgi:hypothetical protein